MKDNKLISMVEFVSLKANENFKTKNNIIEMCEHFKTCVKYMKFLQKPLTLGMFVPCDEYGNIIEYKEPYEDGTNIKYYEARSRVLFAGFEVGNGYVVYGLMSFSVPYFTKYETTIEDILQYGNPTLTETALKQINL